MLQVTKCNFLIGILIHIKGYTSLYDAMASTTSFVKVLPAPDDPINTVGLMACHDNAGKKPTF